MKKESLRIYRTDHRPEAEYLLIEPWVQYNVNYYNDFEININNLNPFFSEYVTIYNIYKNAVYFDYLGFDHYHRIIIFDYENFDESILDNSSVLYFYYQDLKEAFNTFINIVPESEMRFWDSYIVFSRWGVKDLLYDLTKQYILDTLGEDYSCTLYNPNENYIYIKRTIFFGNYHFFKGYGQFICGWMEMINEHFNLDWDPLKYEQFIFDNIYNKTDKDHDKLPWKHESYQNTDMSITNRVLSFILEWLSHIYFKTKTPILYSKFNRNEYYDDYLLLNKVQKNEEN